MKINIHIDILSFDHAEKLHPLNYLLQSSDKLICYCQSFFSGMECKMIITRIYFINEVLRNIELNV
ncbi:CLUMA_CG012442, isoform A [Clunio marinus]|uniref:CLUMA_CG012442, isoform A n=1 Tax=Clunio marinus TaxID=568069 RepID=A0A1J1IEF3_9DIPT|nr:CLUMA_CG012442, isoform A [Clunio marinus]